MDSALETTRKRLRFRCWHRGSREADLLMGPFADRHIARFSEADLADLDRLLEVADPDIYNWLTGREPVPAEHDTRVFRLLYETSNTVDVAERFPRL